MQMRSDIAQASQVDFVGDEQVAQYFLQCAYHVQQALTFGYRQIGHFSDMLIPYNAAESGMFRVVDQHHAAQHVLPNDFAAG